jgi:probable F420-dependent oxidoreductase
MEIGVIYPQNELGDPRAVHTIGLAVDGLGYRHLSAYDHVLGAVHEGRDPPLSGPYTERDPFHDPFVMFAYLAGLTGLKFITGVLVLPQRQTALVARQAADLDLLSGERFTLGVGVGWNPVEYEALGEDFHARGRRIEEQIVLLRRFWTTSFVDFAGSFDRVDRAALNPRPRRSIPIWLGGFADVALRRAATIGDGFIFADGAGDAFAQRGRLAELLVEQGRTEDGFGLHCSMAAPKEPQQVVETALRWKDVGGTHFSIQTMYQGFQSADEHIAYLETVAKALRCAGL